MPSGCFLCSHPSTDRGPEYCFSPGRARRARARESPCQAPEVGRQRVAGGSGVTLLLGVGSRPREASRSAKQRDLTAPPPQKECQTHAPHECAHVLLTCSTSTPHKLRTRMCNRTTHPRGFTHVKHGATRSTAQCARKHLRARSTLALQQKWLLRPSHSATSPLVRDDRYFSQLGHTDTVAEPFSFTSLGLVTDGLRPLARWTVISGFGESSNERGVIRVCHLTCVSGVW